MDFQNINIRQIIPTAISKNAIIVDVREEKRFRESHIHMAINLPLERIENGDVHFPKHRTLIVYCDTGGTSSLAARLLAQMEYRVINCVGGLKSYNGSFTKG